MPCITLTANDTNCEKYEFRLRKHYDVSSVKLLHAYHNIDHDHFHVTADKAHNRLIMARISFLTLDSYESVNDASLRDMESQSYVVLGATASVAHGEPLATRDLFKLLVNEPFHLNQKIKVQLYYRDHEGNIKPLDSAHYDYAGKKAADHATFYTLVLEYE